MVDPVATALGIAQIVVPPFINPVVQNFFNEWLEKRHLKKELGEEIEALSSKMDTIKKFLQDADNKQGENLTVHKWIKDLKEVFYDAEDILDGYITDVAIKKMEFDLKETSHAATTRDWGAKVSNAFTCCFSSHPGDRKPKYEDHLVVANNIKSINKRLNELLDKRYKLGLNVVSEPNQILALKGRKTTWLPDDFPIEGRIEDKKKLITEIINELTKVEKEQLSPDQNDSNKSHTSIFPIVGMGGLGKTTLAKMAFHDDSIKSHFGNMKAWVCVPDNSSEEDAITKIIDSIYHSKGMQQKCNWTDLGILQKELLNLIEGAPFLLVLDDIWEDNIEIGESLLKVLRASKKGHMLVIITTRFINLARSFEGVCYLFSLQGLKDEEIWKILHKYAFQGSNEAYSNDRQLKDIGEKIVERLKGSPLGAKSIGGLLRTDPTAQFWKRVLQSELWKFRHDDKGGIFPILMLSYQHLPTYMKQCLIYFSLFPKDYNIEEYEIIHLWIAHGCIQTDSKKVVVHTGKMYLQNLVDRCFLDYNGDTYSMHDLVHDLIQSMSKYDCYWLSDGTKIEEEKSLRHRHVSLFRVNKENFINGICKNKSQYDKTRTMVFKYYCTFHKAIDGFGQLMESMKYLRALILSHCNLLLLPDSIFNLKHLHLLDLSHSRIIILPESLGHLYNLQVLNLNGCWKLKSVPNNITRLVNLRHLLVEPFISIKGIGRLCLLESSVVFSVYEEDGFHICELKDLNSLQDSLHIRNLEFVKSGSDALKSQVVNKEGLKTLRLEWTVKKDVRMASNEGMVDITQDSKVEEDVLEALKPCESLIEICILGYGGVNLPNWLNESWLSSLEIFKMKHCIKLEKMPPIDEWSNSLRVLELRGCSKVTSLSSYLCKMQLLKKLYLGSLHSLKDIRWEMICLHGEESCLFKSLEDLILEDLSECREWRVVGVEEVEKQNISIFPQLKTLTLKECPKLECIEVPHIETMLKFLNEYEVDTSTWQYNHTDNIVPLRYLYEIEICECPHISSIYLPATLTSLAKLTIQNCRNLHVLHSCAMHVKNLSILRCPKLVSWKLPLPPTECDCVKMTKHEDGIMCVTLFKDYLRRSWDEWKIDCPVTPKFYASSPSMTSPSLVAQRPTSNSNDEAYGLPFPLPTAIASIHFSDFNKEQIGQLSVQIGACAVVHLESLEIENCPDLEHLDADDMQSVLPNLTSSLKYLALRRCPQLKSFSLFDSLEKIGLYQCPLLPSLLDLRPATSLRELLVVDCASLTTLLFTSVRELEVCNCASLTTLLFTASRPLDQLSICSCPNLLHISCGDAHLLPSSSSPSPSSSPLGIPLPNASASSHDPSPLQVSEFWISRCNREQLARLLQQIEPAHFKTLKIGSCSDLEHFDADDGPGAQLGPTFLNFTSLTTLWIPFCQNLKSLPSKLGSRLLLLEEIRLWDCPLLSYLPDLRPLTSLRFLYTISCPKLADKYADVSQWKDISHIQDVRMF